MKLMSITIFVLLMLLTGCQEMPVRDEASPRSRVAIGSRFTLHQPLVVPAGHARVFLQHGEVVAKTRLNRFQPHCNIEIRHVSDGTLRVEPDTFVVTRVTEDEAEIVSAPQPVRRVSMGIDDGFWNDVSQVSRFVRHDLSSPSQPEVMRLTCHGGFAEPWQAEYPSIRDIRNALGERLTLELKGE